MEIKLINKKPEWLEWVYYLIFGVGMLLVVPFIATAMLTTICAFVGKA